MRAIQPSKRYALMVLLFHAQLSKALDDAVDMYVRKLRDVLEAFQEGETNQERGNISFSTRTS